MLSLSKKEVGIILKTGNKIRTEKIDFFLSPKISDLGRILVVISRKVANAPKRNKLRRRLKSIFYEEKLFNEQFDCVAIAKNNSVNLSFVELKNLILNIFKKAKDEKSNN